MNIRTLLNSRVSEAMVAAGIPPECAAHVTPSKNAQFGDYQANGAMAAAKVMKTKPRDLAQGICDKLQLDGIAVKTEIAGPGFINIYLDPTWLAQQALSSSNDSRLNIEKRATAETVVIDYSSPNLAKEMHVGHLRSTIIGDAIARVLEFQGDSVIRQNHVGDWGTQFGMLIAELEDQMSEGESAELALKDLEKFYQQSKKHFDDDENFANRARDYVVKLQGGDSSVLKLWEQFRSVSLTHGSEVYSKLNISLKDADVYGESAYNDDLKPLVSELKALGLAKEDAGAQVVFLQELADKEGNPSPVIIQKKDGGYLYATTDLAAIRYRANTLNAKRVIIVVDDRQSLHLKQVFIVAKNAKFLADDVRLEHKAFGKMLGKDGKPFKTRTGGTIKLAELLDESIGKATQIVKEKNPELSADEIHEVSRKVGIGAVKYADLSKTRTNDYVFDWDSMLSFEGNTGPYLQYAYTRIASIFKKANEEMSATNYPIELNHDAERTLALKALQFSEVIEQVSAEGFPHVLCAYLYELSSNFMSFYEACPILKTEVAEAQRNSRLQLSKLVAGTMKTGLDLLGIETMNRM
ncbi:MAG: arginyl-tRNA synthetase [Flavobacteriales bacterium]|jgi:arginyl-tRNA synthetase